jgi:hypothetical protein
LSVHILGQYPRLEETLCDMLSVSAIDAETEGGAVLAALTPGVDDVGGDDRSIQSVGEFALVELACNHVDRR